MKLPKVKSIAPNQILIYHDGNMIFQSYQSTIFVIDNKGDITLDKIFYNYSTTTIKHRNAALGISNDKFKQNLKNGLYKFDDLNQ